MSDFLTQESGQIKLHNGEVNFQNYLFHLQMNEDHNPTDVDTHVFEQATTITHSFDQELLFTSS